MTRAELLALAERTERAEGADRELDVAIHQTLGRPVLWAIDDDGCEYQALVSVPLYTASLDAALSLVPEGRIVRLLMDPDGRSAAYVNHPGQIADRRLAATPALALVAAALRARAEEAKDE